MITEATQTFITLKIEALYKMGVIIMPILVDFASTANTTISESSNFTDYPGAQEVLIGAPFWIYFIPATLGLAAIVIVLKRK